MNLQGLFGQHYKFIKEDQCTCEFSVYLNLGDFALVINEEVRPGAYTYAHTTGANQVKFPLICSRNPHDNMAL